MAVQGNAYATAAPKAPAAKGGAGGNGLGLTTPGPAAGGQPLTLINPNIANSGAQLIPTSIANSGAQLYSPTIAATLAGTQYNQAILDAKQNLAMTQAGAAQAMGNVQNWWQAILAGENTAGQRDQALTTGVENAEAGNNAGILASLGGAANPAASSVAVAGQNAQAILGGLGLSNEQYHNDMAPILRQGAAGALGQQQNANETNIAKAMQGVNDQVAAKGAAQAQDAYQIMKDNNSIKDNRATRLLDIIGANNTTKDNRVTTGLQINAANNATIQGNRTFQHTVANDNRLFNHTVTQDNRNFGEAVKQDDRNYQLAQDQFTESQKNDNRNYQLQMKGIANDNLKTKLGVIMTLGFDPKTGTLSTAAQGAVTKLFPGIDPKALTGSSASIIAAATAASAKASAVAAAAGVKAATVDDSASAKRGMLVDHNGNVIMNTSKQPIVMPGWQLDPKSPSGVSQIPAGQPGSTLKATSTASGDRVMQGEVTKAVDSWIKPADTMKSVPYQNAQGQTAYHTVRVPGQELSWGDMQQRVDGITDPREKAMYVKYMDSRIPEGTNGRPFTTPALANSDALTRAKAAIQSHVSVDQFIQTLSTSPVYQSPAGHAAIIKAVEQVYHLTADPGRQGSLHDSTGTTIPVPNGGTDSQPPAPYRPVAPPQGGFSMPRNPTTGATLPGMLPPAIYKR